jgi:quinol monooxygenase YgiN
MTAAGCSVIELRRYRLRPGSRETLIELFERELIEPQEAVGLFVLGQFRDLDDPDSFVWLRGFEDMAERERGLSAFYGGPVWQRHRDAANATMIDSDDVLLLRPAREDSVPPAERGRRAAPAMDNGSPSGLVVCTTCSLGDGDADEFVQFFGRELEPALNAAGATVSACYRSEYSPNTFPALPVREGENVFAWLSRFADEEAHREHLTALAGSFAWRDRLAGALRERLRGDPLVARLIPTARSVLRG